MAKGRHAARSWWESQGYRADHPVHSEGTEFWTKNTGPTPAEEFEGEVEHQEGMARRGGPVRLTVAPTRTSDPSRPRTLAAGYDGKTNTLTVVFREGAQYEYYGVTTAEWWRFRRSGSPGRFINRVLNDKDYLRISG